MRKILTTSLIISLLATCLPAQAIWRSVICSTGSTLSGNAGTLTATFGQCPGCGTLEGSAGYLTQGFQQPSGKDCKIEAAFEYQENTGNCGTTFDFSFTGNTANANVTYEWDFGQDAFPQTSNMVDPQGVAYAVPGMKTVQLKLTTTGCQRIAMLDILVSATGFSTNPVVTNIACKGQRNGAIELEFNGGTQPFTVNWSDGSTGEAMQSAPAGDYAYTVTDAIGCTSSNMATIAEPTDTVSVQVAVTNETCAGDNDGQLLATAAGGTPPYQFLWSNNATGDKAEGLSGGIYTATVTDSRGCSVSFEAKVGQMCTPGITDILTPNGDGENETWIIEDIESFPDNEVEMFNRWGERVWNVKGYDNTWTGTNNRGQPLPVGAYYFMIHLNDVSNTVLTGSLTIVR
jgi:gliding motility-associated-like protein